MGGRVSDEVSEDEMGPEPIPQSNIGRQSFCCAPLVRAGSRSIVHVLVYVDCAREAESQ